MAQFPAMPLWTDAYLADCGHLDDAEQGRYLLILIHLWRAPGQRFPNDDAWLARKFRRSEEEVRAQLRPIIKEFCSSDGNWITQGRLKREFAYVSASSARQSVRAKLRWNKEKDVSPGNAGSGIAPTPTPSTKRETKVSQKKGTRLEEDWTLPQPWGQWALEQGLERREVLSQGERFHDYWIGVPGQRGFKLDWRATWRNWIRSAVARGDFTNGGPSKQREKTASDHIMKELDLDGKGKAR